MAFKDGAWALVVAEFMERKTQRLAVVLAQNLAVAAVVLAAAVLPRWALPSGGTEAIPVLWTGAGIALGAALVLGWRVLPGIFLPFAASGAFSDFPWTFWLLSPLGLCASVLFAQKILEKTGFDRRLCALKDIFLFAGLGAVLSMALAGFWTTNCLLLSGKLSPDKFGQMCLFYSAAYAGGALVVAPALLLLASGRLAVRRIGWARLGMAGVQLAAVFLSTWLVFSDGNDEAGALSLAAYLPFPFVVWAALSGGMGVASLAVLVCALTASGFTGADLGPFASQKPLDAILHLQAFLGIFATTGLLIGAGTESRWREKALQAEAATRKAELERLKAQVNPHFLFNCLTAIHSLVRTDSAAAEQGLTSLSSLLRRSLDVAKHPLIPLAEELEIIREALRLQKMRYEEGLEWSVGADKEAENFRVPPMLLQPLVENAVKHGVDDGFGRVDLTAVIEAGDLVVRVRNTAPKGSDPAAWKESVGLASVRARIAEACPEESGVVFSKTADGWIEALVRIKPVVGGKMK